MHEQQNRLVQVHYALIMFIIQHQVDPKLVTLFETNQSTN